MWSKKHIRNGYDSYLDRIQEHLQKIETAREQHMKERVRYYIKEIQRNFFDNIKKDLKRTEMTKEQQHRFILLQQQFDDITSLSWD